MTHKLTRLLALMLAVVMTVSMLLVPVEAASFRDVTDGSWYAAAVEYVNERGWMAGVSETSFAPNAEVTRGMMVTVLARLAGAETDNDTAAFADTAAGRWYTGAAAWAAEQGIVAGIGGGRFAPTRAITRQDLCVMLYAYIEAMGIKLDNTIDRTFSDMGSVADYAREAVIYCAGTGLIAGYTDSTFGPKQTATRAQLAQILMRLDLLLKGEEAPADPMPAQSFDGETDDMNVFVSAPEGAFPENTEMSVSRVTDGAALLAIQSQTNSTVLGAVDISFAKGGEEIEPETEVEVSIRLDSISSANNPRIVHLRDDGILEPVESRLVSGKRGATTTDTLRFYAKDFSVYAVTDDAGGGTASLTIYFHVRKNSLAGPSNSASNWEVVNKQILQINERYLTKDNPIYDPGVPAITETQAFEGWTTNRNFTEDEPGISVEEINAYFMTQAQNYLDDDETTSSIFSTGSKEYHYYAEVYDVFYVFYRDQNAVVTKTQSFHKDGATANVFVNNTYAPFLDSQQFLGWVIYDYDETNPGNSQNVLSIGERPTYGSNPTVYQNGSTYPVGMTLDLFPYVREGHWLVFDTNIDANNTANNFDDDTSASYTSPVFYPSGTNTAAPTKPTRTGYSFGGWYTDSDMRNAFTFGSELTRETKLYAKWTPAETTYNVVFMIQDASDSNTENVYTDNHYSYYDSISRNWTGSYTVRVKTGNTVSACSTDGTLASADITPSNAYVFDTFREDKTIHKLGQYFFYSGKNNDTSVRVKGDGSSVLNVYYDRKCLTVNFYTPTFSSTTIQYTNVQYFYRVGSSSSNYKYYPLSHSTWTESDEAADYTCHQWTANNYKYLYQYIDYNSTYEYYGYSDTSKWYTWSNGDWSQISSAPTVYTADNGTPQTFTELYGRAANGEFPTLDTSKQQGWYYNDYHTHSGTDITSYTVSYDYDVGSDPYTANYYRANYLTSTNIKTVYCYSQDPETGDWGTLWYDTEIDDAYVRIFGDGTGHVLYGYNVYGQYSTPDADSHMVRIANQVNIYYEGNGNTTDGQPYYGIVNSAASVYYELTTANLVFVSNNEEVGNHSLRYGQQLAPFKYDPEHPGEDFIPSNGRDGYTFKGWYTDSTYQNKFDFSGTMGTASITLYAKWELTRYRFFLDYSGGDENVTVTFPGGGQASTFRLDWGEKIEDTAIAACERDGYILLGWYSDPEFKHPFNFNMGMSDDLVNRKADLSEDTAWYYGVQMPGETDEQFKARMNSDARRGTDPVIPGRTYDDTWDTDWETRDYSNWEALGYETQQDMIDEYAGQRNVLHTITIYAKWRQDPEGATGVRVHYLGDNEPDLGLFETGDRPHEWTAPNIYTDQALAYAQPASVPVDENDNSLEETKQFLYWQLLVPVLDENDEYVRNEDGTVKMQPSGKIIYPGQTFDIDLNDAVEIRTPLPDPNCTHEELEHRNATPATCTADGYPESWVCTACGKRFADAEATTLATAIPKLGHQWGDITYTWTPSTLTYDSGARCTCTAVCQRNSNHKLAKAVNAVVVVDTDPTYEATGLGHYYADFNDEALTNQSSGSFVIPKLVPKTVHFQCPAGVTAPADQSVEPGTAITLPTAGAPSGATFLGWVTGEIEDTDELPAFQAAGATVRVEDDTTFIALYSYEVSRGYRFELVNTTPSSWTGRYVITRGKTAADMVVLKGIAANTSYESVDVHGAVDYYSSGMTLEDDALINVGDTFIFAAAKVSSSSSYYTFTNAATGHYLARYATSDEALLYSMTTNYSGTNSSYASYFRRWQPSLQSGGNVKLTNGYSSSLYTSWPTLGYSGSYFWVANTSSTSAESIYFWKENTSEPISQTRYATLNSAIPTHTVSFSVASGSAPASQSCTAGAAILLPDATAPSGYAFAGWTKETTGDTMDRPEMWCAGAMYVPEADGETLIALYTYSDTYFELQTAVPDEIEGYYVISSGTTAGSSYMMKYPTGGASYYNTNTLRTALPTVTTEDGKKRLRSVNIDNVFYVSASDTTGYYTIETGSSTATTYYVADGSNGLTAKTSEDDYGRWQFTYNTTANVFRVTSIKYSSYGIYYKSSSQVFDTTNTTSSGVCLWKFIEVPHYLTSIPSGSVLPAPTDAVGELNAFRKGGETEAAENTVELEAEPDGKPDAAEPEAEPDGKPEAAQPASDVAALDGPVTEAETRAIGGNPDPGTAVGDVTYRLATSIEAGKTYLIVYGNGTTAASSTASDMKVMNSYRVSSTYSGYRKPATPTFESGSNNGVITAVDTSSTGTVADCEWTVASGTGTYSSAYTFVNDGYYLVETSSSDGNLECDNENAYPNYKYWTVDKAASGEYFNIHNTYWHSQNSNTWYYLYYSNSNSGFTNYYMTSYPQTGQYYHMFLYEKVVEAGHTVTFVDYDGSALSGSAYDEQHVSDGNTVTRPSTDPTRTGYTFVGWRVNGLANALFDFSWEFGGSQLEGITDITLYASYVKNVSNTDTWVPYTADTIDPTLDYLIGVKDGSTVYLIQNYNPYGSRSLGIRNSSETWIKYMGYMATATMSGDNVVGANLVVNSTTTQAVDLCYSTWRFSTASGGTVTGQDGDANLKLAMSSNTGDYNGTTYTYYYARPETTGSTFTWSKANGTLVSSSLYAGHYIFENSESTSNGVHLLNAVTSAPSTTIQLYVREQDVIETHTITFKGNYTGAPADKTQTVNHNVPTNLTAAASLFTRSGYTFRNWNTAADGTGSTYTDGQSVTRTEDLTLYAQWTEQADPLDEALNVTGGTLDFYVNSSDTYPWYVPEGQSYAQSGNYHVSRSNSYLYLDLAMQAGDKLTFKYWVSSEASYDYFVFHDDGTESYSTSYVTRDSGNNQVWTTYEYTAATAGTYHFVWQYYKDSATNTGSDCARLDDVAYVPAATYRLTIHYRDNDNQQILADSYVDLAAGATYTVEQTIPGYHMVSTEAERTITMPAADTEITVVYEADVVSMERWEPTQEITENEDYLIAYVLNPGTANEKVYLLLNTSDVNNSDYYTFMDGSNTRYMGWLGLASIVSENGVDYVSGVSGATSSLQNAHWQFTSAGDDLYNIGNEGKYLYWRGSTSMGGVIPYSSADTWKWTPNSGNYMGTMHNVFTSSGTSYTMYFYPRTSTGTMSTTTSEPYAGVSQTPFPQIRLYHKVTIVGETTWTVTFEDGDGHQISSQDVTDGSRIAAPGRPPMGETSEENAAFYADHYFLGWYVKGTDNLFDFNTEIHADTVLEARFMLAYKVEYTIQLQAVYGIKNPDATTHIYWYKNDGGKAHNGAGARYISEKEVVVNGQTTTTTKLDIGEEIPIPYPELSRDGTGVLYQGDDGTALYKAGSKFLGWARLDVPPGDSGTEGRAYPNLTEDNLYFKWDETSHKFLYNYHNDDETKADEWVNLPSQKVYATEERPYHDFYAVWAPVYYYVFHSWSGVLEQRTIELSTGSTFTASSVIQPVDLTAAVPVDMLYGGYYKTYGGVSVDKINEQIRVLEGSAATSVNMSSVSGSEFVQYTGASMTVDESGPKFWTKADAYKVTDSMTTAQKADVNGQTMRPQAGQVYYLKEVPADYLKTKFYYVYNHLDGSDALTDLYMVSAIDDASYAQIGFKVLHSLDGNLMEETLAEKLTKRTVVAKSLKFTTENNPNPDPDPIYASSFDGVSGGLLEILKLTDEDISANSVYAIRPAWETLDGVGVCGHVIHKAEIGETADLAHITHGDIEASYKRIYVNTNNGKVRDLSNQIVPWNSDGAGTKVYFFGNGNCWKELHMIGDTGIGYVDIPDGYTSLILVRYNSANSAWSGDNGYWDSDGLWAKTVDIPLIAYKNYISSFTCNNTSTNQPTWGEYVPN